MGIAVKNEIKCYEKNGIELSVDREIIIVESHWNYSDRVVLCVGETKYTLLGQDLRRAIDNALNHK